MISLFDHLADAEEACTASRLISPQRETLKVRQDPICEIPDGTRLELEGAITLGFTDPATAKERSQIFQ
jgi:hypothetical protein